MTGSLRALQVLGPSTGGIRVHVAALASGLERRGLDAPVVGPAGVLDGLGVQAGVVGVPGSMSPLGLQRARRQLRPWRARSDVIHVHGLKSAWVALAGRPARPLVVTVHNVVLDETAGRAASMQRRLERYVLGRADRVIAPTGAIAERVDGAVASDRIRVVAPVSPPPEPSASRAEVRARWGVSDDTPTVVCVARLHPQKDLETLLGAWAMVAAHHRAARLVLVGEGPSRAELESLVATLGVADSVVFAGFSAHAVDELAAADVMALTSVWEAIPLVLVEAMQLGLPVVSTNVGVASELLAVTDPSGLAGGAVVPVGDVGGVARALGRFLSDPAEARAAGEFGRSVVATRHDPDLLVSGVVEVYEEVA